MKSDDNYIRYLEAVTEYQADLILRLTTLIIFENTFLNSIQVVQLGRSWLEKNRDEILADIIRKGGIKHAVEELNRNV